MVGMLAVGRRESLKAGVLLLGLFGLALRTLEKKSCWQAGTRVHVEDGVEVGLVAGSVRTAPGDYGIRREGIAN